MKIKELLKEAINKLNKAGIQEPISKARRLLAFTLRVPKEYLIMHDEDNVDIENINKYNSYTQELIEGKPIQYITGKQEFMGIDFEVNENVLIPQPDTEVLVEKVIELVKAKIHPIILDLCTGSGAIAVSIAKFAPEANIYASDISTKALDIAKINDKNKKVTFIQSDLFENIKTKFDIIVSNPPYIKTSEIELLSKEVQNEPLLALDGGQDGLDFYRKIITQAPEYLTPQGHLCLEIGEDQRERIVELIKDDGHYKNIQSHKDLAGNDRIIICEKS